MPTNRFPLSGVLNESAPVAGSMTWFNVTFALELLPATAIVDPVWATAEVVAVVPLDPAAVVGDEPPPAAVVTGALETEVPPDPAAAMTPTDNAAPAATYRNFILLPIRPGPDCEPRPEHSNLRRAAPKGGRHRSQRVCVANSCWHVSPLHESSVSEAYRSRTYEPANQVGGLVRQLDLISVDPRSRGLRRFGSDEARITASGAHSCQNHVAISRQSRFGRTWGKFYE